MTTKRGADHPSGNGDGDGPPHKRMVLKLTVDVLEEEVGLDDDQENMQNDMIEVEVREPANARMLNAALAALRAIPIDDVPDEPVQVDVISLDELLPNIENHVPEIVIQANEMQADADHDHNYMIQPYEVHPVYPVWSVNQNYVMNSNLAPSYLLVPRTYTLAPLPEPVAYIDHNIIPVVQEDFVLPPGLGNAIQLPEPTALPPPITVFPTYDQLLKIYPMERAGNLAYFYDRIRVVDRLITGMDEAEQRRQNGTGGAETYGVIINRIETRIGMNGRLWEQWYDNLDLGCSILMAASNSGIALLLQRFTPGNLFMEINIDHHRNIIINPRFFKTVNGILYRNPMQLEQDIIDWFNSIDLNDINELGHLGFHGTSTLHWFDQACLKVGLIGLTFKMSSLNFINNSTFSVPPLSQRAHNCFSWMSPLFDTVSISSPTRVDASLANDLLRIFPSPTIHFSVIEGIALSDVRVSLNPPIVDHVGDRWISLEGVGNVSFFSSLNGVTSMSLRGCYIQYDDLVEFIRKAEHQFTFDGDVCATEGQVLELQTIVNTYNYGNRLIHSYKPTLVLLIAPTTCAHIKRVKMYY